MTVTFSTIVQISGPLLTILAVVATAKAALLARQMEPDLGDNLRELTHILESILSSTKIASQELRDTLRRTGNLEGRDILVPLEIITDSVTKEHQRLAELKVLDFSTTISDAAH